MKSVSPRMDIYFFDFIRQIPKRFPSFHEFVISLPFFFQVEEGKKGIYERRKGTPVLVITQQCADIMTEYILRYLLITLNPGRRFMAPEIF